MMRTAPMVSTMTTSSAETMLRKWATDDPERVIGRGHPIGDFLDAFDWLILSRSPGCMRIRARMPDRVMNPRGDLFGGFTPTYVDFFGLHVFHTLRVTTYVLTRCLKDGFVDAFFGGAKAVFELTFVGSG